MVPSLFQGGNKSSAADMVPTLEPKRLTCLEPIHQSKAKWPRPDTHQYFTAEYLIIIQHNPKTVSAVYILCKKLSLDGVQQNKTGFSLLDCEQ